MQRSAVVLAGLALSGALTACSDDEPATSTVSDTATSRPSTSASTTPSSAAVGDLASPGPARPSASAARSPAGPSPATSAGPAPVPFEADTSTDEQAPSGGPLSVVAVRVAAQNGYDRVVFELDGTQAGAPGWRVEYVEDPASQGSGEPVQLDGAAALSVSIRGTGYPMDTGVEELSGQPTLPAGLARVRDLHLGAVFEGDYEAFVGVSERAPFRVFRLADPARVVIDIRAD